MYETYIKQVSDTSISYRTTYGALIPMITVQIVWCRIVFKHILIIWIVFDNYELNKL